MGWVIFILILAIIAGVIYLGIKRAKMNSVEEGNVNIFENGVKLCEGETFVRSYNCAQLRSRYLKRITAKGILTVTNRRVVFHTIGVKNDDDFIHDEVPIADVSGISIQSGMVNDSALNAVLPGLGMLFSSKKSNKKIFSLTIVSKGGSEGVINIVPTNSKGTMVDISGDMEPTKVVIEMGNEIGAMIGDIQTLGDMGVAKWRQK